MRAHTVIESLRTHHRVQVFTHDQAYDMLQPVYRGSDVRIHEIPGMRFRYNARHELDYPATLLGVAPYLQRLLGNVAAMARMIEAQHADLVITDFEPLVAWGAKWAGVPFISLDHQHFITACDFSCLPLALRMRVDLMAPFVSVYYSGQAETIVSGFAFPPLKKRAEAIQVGVLLRREILRANTEDGSHLTAYIRRVTTDAVIRALSNCRSQVRVYGLGKRPNCGNLSFKEIDPNGFVEDLATGQALITTAGNQLVGESLYLGKPVLALPEPGNFEQQLNGFLLEQSGAGASLPATPLTAHMVDDFVSRVHQLRSRIDRTRMNGNPAVMSVLSRYLGQAAATDARAAA
jgi:uncharacterized protein (TIGR00661 family)